MQHMQFAIVELYYYSFFPLTIDAVLPALPQPEGAALGTVGRFYRNGVDAKGVLRDTGILDFVIEVGPSGRAVPGVEAVTGALVDDRLALLAAGFGEGRPVALGGGCGDGHGRGH